MKLYKIKDKKRGSSLVAQQVEDLVLLLWHGFNPQPGNFQMLQVQRRKEGRKEGRKEEVKKEEEFLKQKEKKII